MILALHRMARGKVFEQVPALDEGAGFMDPLLIPEAVKIVSQVIGDV